MSAFGEAKPPRPSLPPLLLAALALWAATALLWPAAFLAPHNLLAASALVGAAGATGLAVLCVRRRQASILVAGVLGALAALSLSWEWGPWPRFPQPVLPLVRKVRGRARWWQMQSPPTSVGGPTLGRNAARVPL